jgi:hypothetical protein
MLLLTALSHSHMWRLLLHRHYAWNEIQMTDTVAVIKTMAVS